MKKIAIVGYGRFGKTLEKLLKKDFELIIFTKKTRLEKLKKADVVFYCVPISLFEKVLKTHLQFLNNNQLIIDVLSVKLYPEKIFKKYLKNRKIQAILTHPMFGPDSSKSGFKGLTIMMSNFNASDESFYFWQKYFLSKGLNVVKMSAKEHDKLAASSQGVTHFIGRVLGNYGFKSTSIDTMGAKKLLEVVNQTCNDNLRLFKDLQTFNPYTKKMIIKIGKAYERVYNWLLPKRANSKKIIIGIQGGRGSFNEEAANFIMKKINVKKYRVKYLYTTEKVLKNLNEGNIDYGVFAIQNSIGGLVTESAYAMAKYRFKIIEEFAIKIRHFLMKRKDVDFSKITQIMAHPQVFKQCRLTLSKKYPLLKQISGEGDMIDTARSARALALGEVPKTTAILGPKKLAEIYSFDIIDSNLQDLKDNQTTFFLVKR